MSDRTFPPIRTMTTTEIILVKATSILEPYATKLRVHRPVRLSLRIECDDHAWRSQLRYSSHTGLFSILNKPVPTDTL